MEMEQDLKDQQALQDLKDQQALQVPQDLKGLKVCPRLFVPSLAQVLHPTVLPMVLRQGQAAICGLLL